MTAPAPPSLISLSERELNLDIAPGIGGSIAAFYSRREGQIHHWLRPATPQALRDGQAEGMASFPLVPFCNRIRDGRFTFEGRPVALPPNRGGSPHTIHGYGWQQAWTVLEQGADAARLQLDYPGDVWPYPFGATQSFALRGGALTVDIEIENRGSAPMPYGLGHHPYLPHRPGTTLTTSVEAMWGGDAQVMPTGLEQPRLLERMRAGVLLADVVQDNNFIGWDHAARVDWPAAAPLTQASSLTLRADAPLDYFVLYSPQAADHFCIEPVSNCTDWLNLGHYRPAQVGGAVLAPGARAQVRFTLTPEWAPR
ncbi:MAG: aldose 1-epimerase [Pseudomonadota bacterium]